MIKDPNFFLYHQGIINPENELSKNLENFKVNIDYACQFPARAKFLSKKFLITYKLCEKVEAWKKGVSADGLSYVLVSQYVSTPASAFGHSFIVFKNLKLPTNLNLSLNYAAQMPSDVSLYDYFTKGLGGGYYGVFDFEPLYIKLQEYSSIENREMWEYDLNFNADQLDQFLNHIWELIHKSKEGYYFLNSNCSVSLYNSIAAVHSEVEFLNSSHLYVLPVTTLKQLEKISSRQKFIPSLREKIKQNYENLNEVEKHSFNKFLIHKKTASDLGSINSKEIELLYFEFLKTNREGKLTEAEKITYENSLMQRSKMGPISLEPTYFSSNPPHLSQGTWRLGAGLNFEKQHAIPRVIFSPASHRLLQSDNGFLPHSEISLFEVKIDNQSRNIYNLKELTLFSLKNFTPTILFDQRFAWTAKAQIIKSSSCDECFNFNGELNMGLSNYIFDQLGYALFGFSDDKDQVIHPQIKIGTILKYGIFRSNIEIKHIEPLNQVYNKADIISLSIIMSAFRNFDIELNVSSEDSFSQGSVILNNYF